MPCRDYESDSWGAAERLPKLKEQMDKLARIACKAMTALEENGIEDFLLLQDEEVREWWAAHKEADRKERARVAEQERRARVREEALARLSAEEKELLGLAEPAHPRAKKMKKSMSMSVSKQPAVEVEYDYEADDDPEWAKDDLYIDLSKIVKKR